MGHATSGNLATVVEAMVDKLRVVHKRPPPRRVDGHPTGGRPVENRTAFSSVDIRVTH